MNDTNSPTQDAAYARAGFGARSERGTAPALVVVDFQRGFTEAAFDTGADMGSSIAAVNLLIDCMHEHDRRVVFTIISYSDAEVFSGAYPWLQKFQGGMSLRDGSAQVELDPRLHVSDIDIVIIKKGPSAFFGTSLNCLLVAWGVDTVLIAGATTSGCVRASVADSVQSGFPTLVPREAVADRAVAPHESNLYDMDQKYADVISIHEAISYLQTSLPKQRS